ncbi:MAG: hypothetical protein C5B48_06580, partial [Candidatus Rokuibacteriota bacterium]
MREGTDQEQFAARLTLLADIARDLLSAPEPSAIPRAVFDRLAGPMGLDVYLAHVVSDDGSGLHLHSSAGLSDEMLAAIERDAHAESLWNAVAAQRAPVVAEDIQTSADPRVAAASLGLQAY